MKSKTGEIIRLGIVGVGVAFKLVCGILADGARVRGELAARNQAGA